MTGTTLRGGSTPLRRPTSRSRGGPRGDGPQDRCSRVNDTLTLVRGVGPSSPTPLRLTSSIGPFVRHLTALEETRSGYNRFDREQDSRRYTHIRSQVGEKVNSLVQTYRGHTEEKVVLKSL